MKFDRIIKRLLATAKQPEIADPGGLKRHQARAAWVSRAAEAWRQAQLKADEAWSRIAASLPDDIPDAEFQKLAPPEQLQADALRVQLDAVMDHDKWPKHLHWSKL